MEDDILWAMGESDQEISIGGVSQKAIVDALYMYGEKNYKKISVIIHKNETLKEGDTIEYDSVDYVIEAFTDEYDEKLTQFIARTLRGVKR